MTVYIVRVSGKGTEYYHTDRDCVAFNEDTTIRETDKETAENTYGAELCGRCAPEKVWIRKSHVETYHKEKCRYLARATNPRQVTKETAIEYFEAESCSVCYSPDRSHFEALQAASE